MNKEQFNKRFDEFNINNQYCYNCGKPDYLSRAHIIRVSLRKDLEFDFNNVKYLCMTQGDRMGCHNIWDDGSAEEIKERFRNDVLREILLYIKSKSIFIYNRKMEKLNLTV